MMMMMMMMVMMMMMNCFCGMVDRRKAFSLISSRDHYQRSSPSQISNTPRAGFEPAQNLTSGLVERSCAVVITTTPWCHKWYYIPIWVYWKCFTVFIKYVLICVVFGNIFSKLRLGYNTIWTKLFSQVSSIKKVP